MLLFVADERAVDVEVVGHAVRDHRAAVPTGPADAFGKTATAFLMSPKHREHMFFTNI